MLVTQHPIFRRFWYPVIPMARLADGPQPFTLLGTPLVLWLDEAGRPAAALDRCCHRSAQLSRGRAEGGRIVCGYHGWAYDRDGRCVRMPQAKDQSREIKFGITAHRCVERYGYAWVALEEPLYAVPEFPEAADPAFRRIDQFYEPWDVPGLRVMENSFDPAHPQFVHAGTFGVAYDPDEPAEITPFDGGFNYFHESRVANPALQQRNLGIADAVTVRRRFSVWWMPFVMKLAIHYPNGLIHAIVMIATPIDDRRSMIVQWCYRNDTEADAPAAGVIAFDRQVTLEDKAILETTDPDVPLDGSGEFNMPSDRAGLQMRRMLAALIARETNAPPVAVAAV
ncbi:MAG: aromatic ring-hydroxylating dioxygenase subunit alpha [Alphaproteobacteria bacterium]|nr:aromatic ring-hydroxylating dioxygenase subunit alpha [Alphaproteobacteria bacterium]